MEIEITIEEMIKLMKALVEKEQKFEKPKLRTNLEVHQVLVAEEAMDVGIVKTNARRAPWSQAEKAWLFAQGKPSKGNNHHSDELKQRFGVKRTDKSISACWRRFHDNN